MMNDIRQMKNDKQLIQVKLCYKFKYRLLCKIIIIKLSQLINNFVSQYRQFMPKDKEKNAALNTSTNHINRIKKYQQYFDSEKTYNMTPHSRSLPKKKTFFKDKDKDPIRISSKKPKNRRQSIPLQKPKSKKMPANPHLLSPSQNQKYNVQYHLNGNGNMLGKSKSKQKQKSRHKISHGEYSTNKQYDSPSKQNQHEQIDFILGERIGRARGKDGREGRERDGKEGREGKEGKNGKKLSSLVESTIEKVYEELGKNNLNQAIQMLKSAIDGVRERERMQKQGDLGCYDLNYLLGVCHLLNGSYEQAINIFDGLLAKKAKKNIYLMLSVCYKKMEDYQETEKILNQCLKKNPKSYQTYIYRGKLYLKLKKFKQALSDFQKAIKISPDKQIGYIGRGDCLRLCQKYEQAKTSYAKALNMSKKICPSILLRRAICNMQLKRYEPAFDDIEQLLSTDPQNSEALYFKGLIFNKQKLQNDAIICYEQAIKHNTNKKAVTRSIYEIAKIKIQHRDYYQALYTLERAKFLDIEERVIRKFKIFADGVTELMKKNFQTGIKILSQLVDGQGERGERPVGNFLKPIVYSSRAYGYMSLGKFQQAKEDLEKLENQYSLDIPNLYNKFICEGIMACNSQKYEQALAFFSKAGKIMPSKVQPYFYKAATLVCFISKLIPKDMKVKQRQYLQSAMKTANKCDRQIQNNPSLLLVRSFLHYSLGQAEKAIQDLDKCMQESLKHQPIHFYLNGMILAEHYGRYQDAIQQFKKALNAQSDHKIPEIYLNRAKCLLLLGEINSGFVDLQTYMSFRPSSPQIHIWAGHLLFFIGATEDAAKAYSNISNLNKNPEVLLFRAKCYLNSKNVIDTLSNLKLILDAKYDNKVYFDYHVLDALRECSEQGVDYGAIMAKVKQAKKRAFSTGEGKWGYFVKEQDYQFYKGVLYFYMGQYEMAGKNFQRGLRICEEFVAQKVASSSDYLQFYKLSYNNIPYNYVQCLFNITLCQIMSKNMLKAVKRLKTAIEKCPQGQTKNQLQLFLHTLQTQIRTQFDRKPNSQAPEAGQLNPFPSDNRLCSIFPELVLPTQPPIQTRLSFCLPSVQKPDIRPHFDDKLFDEINMSTIQIKPQAPWIKRSEEGVIFTDDVVGCEVELSRSSDKGDGDAEDGEEEVEQEHEEEEEEEDGLGYRRHENYERNSQGRENDDDDQDQDDNDRPVMMRPQDFKNIFKLDPSVQAKLAKLKK